MLSQAVLGARLAQRLPTAAAAAAAYSQRRAASELAGKKLLVANRGEIACRIFRTAKRLGMKTVAVYSEADAMALHRRMADESVLLGPAPSSQSYLNQDRLIEAIEKLGVNFVAPGYGFLSENSKFSRRLQDIGVEFVGPKEHAIQVMGDKLESKVTADNAGVSIIPGFNGIIESEDHARQIANEIGYPVMIKASAGGGGKGMRVAWNDKEVISGYHFCKDESKSSFGDDRLLVEKFITRPRHIEIQVLADRYGNALWLNERECSVQRRNQKVVEEAPSIFLDEATRRTMGEQAVALAKAVGYESAGTVEFIVDSNKQHFFLEMNTRLQVEHPITELITGVDLVEQMLRVANGEELQIKQEDIGINGWAVESRVYAEDSYHMLPSTGVLHTYIEPHNLVPDVRCDSGVVEGSEISIYYDPMISKLVTHGVDRADALAKMNKALDAYVIKGVKHNIPLLRDIINQERFVKGDLTTSFIEEVYPEGFKGYELSAAEKDQLVAMSVYVFTMRQLQNQRYTNQTNSPSSLFYAGELVATVGGEEIHASVDLTSANSIDVTIDGRVVPIEANWTLGTPIFEAEIAGAEVIGQYLGRKGSTFQLRLCGSEFDVTVRPEEEHKFMKIMPEKPEEDHSLEVAAPMPGTLLEVLVQPGDRVAAGEALVTIESMKMQNALTASRSGVVARVNFAAGATLSEGDVIIELEKEEDKKQ